MKKIFYIIALGIALAGCSNNEDELLSTGSFPEDHVIRVITEVNEPLSRAGYDAMNLERFGLMIRNSENAAYNYHKQMVGSGSAWSTSDGQQMLWDAERTPVTMIAYAHSGRFVDGQCVNQPVYRRKCEILRFPVDESNS